MTEFDHRAEAVRLLAVANDRHCDSDPEGAAIFTQQAQVHATLAAIPPPVEYAEAPMIVNLGEPATFQEVVAFAAQKSTELEELRTAARKLLAKLDTGAYSQPEREALRELVR